MTALRCLREVELHLNPRRNYVFGPNGAGKTSLLEGVFVLGRGRSFRTRQMRRLVQHGNEGFAVFGEVAAEGATRRLGVAYRAGRLEKKIDGQPASGMAQLAELLPVHAIDPSMHALVEGGPSERRRFLDWGVFHVEHAFLPTWRRYHLALRQRNAALKQDAGDDDLAAWERELAASGEALAAQREAFLSRIASPLNAIGLALLDQPVSLVHHAGWDRDRPLLDALASDRRRDRRYRATQLGPHRGDIVVQVGGRAAKDHVSRGQQKLVAAGLMLAQLEIQEQEKPGRSALLLDDPAAELDRENLARLMQVVQRARAQLWVTSLRGDLEGLPDRMRVFHVEQGSVRAGG